MIKVLHEPLRNARQWLASFVPLNSKKPSAAPRPGSGLRLCKKRAFVHGCMRKKAER